MAAEISYWNGKGKYQALYEEVNKLIPWEGPVPNAHKNRALERLRRAANCYYDLFNNGLCNRAAEFRRVFGFGGTIIVKCRYNPNTPEAKRLEETMDDLIILAALEQRISITPYLSDEISEQEVA